MINAGGARVYKRAAGSGAIKMTSTITYSAQDQETGESNILTSDIFRREERKGYVLDYC